MATTATTPPAHTPGPWMHSLSTNEAVYGNQEHFCVLVHPETGNGQIVADLETLPEAEANARLIAASPTLLLRCKMSLHDARDALRGDWIPTADGWQSIIDDLSAVIAAAEGR